jgi:hypothetical protein
MPYGGQQGTVVNFADRTFKDLEVHLFNSHQQLMSSTDHPSKCSSGPCGNPPLTHADFSAIHHTAIPMAQKLSNEMLSEQLDG